MQKTIKFPGENNKITFKVRTSTYMGNPAGKIVHVKGHLTFRERRYFVNTLDDQKALDVAYQWYCDDKPSTR